MRVVLMSAAFWNPHYRFLFCHVCLPSLLAPGNLPALAGLAPIEFLIWCTDEDRAYLASRPVFARLETLATVRFQRVERDQVTRGPGGSTLLLEAFRSVMAEAHERGGALSVIWPDTCFADGSFAALRQRMDAGARAVVLPVISMVAENTAHRLTTPEAAARGDALAVPARQLAALALANVHPRSGMLFDDSPRFGITPAYLYWRLGSDAVLARTFHPCPTLLFPRRYDGMLKIGWDYDAIERTIDPEDVVFITDSDQALVVELNKELERRDNPAGSNRMEAREVASWALFFTSPSHMAHADTATLIHVGDLGDATPLIQHSQAFVDEAVGLVRSWRGFTNDLRLEYLRHESRP